MVLIDLRRPQKTLANRNTIKDPATFETCSLTALMGTRQAIKLSFS